MNKRKGLHLLAGFVGLGAWLLFILACTGWPSWSPDGNKILFPYSGADDWGIALYDRAAGAVVPVFNLSSPRSDSPPHSNPPTPTAQFVGDGKQAIVVLRPDSEDEPTEVLLFSFDGNKPLRVFVLPKSAEASLPPYPEVAGELFLGSSYIARLNLKSGAIETKELREGKGIHLMPGGGHVWYSVYGIKRAGNGAMQIGELNPNDLSLKPLFEFLDSDMKALGVTDLMPLVPEPRSIRFATSGQMGENPVLLLFNKGGLERVVKPHFPARGYKLGEVAWSADGKTIYAPAVSPANRDTPEFSVTEIPVDGGAIRMIPIATLAQSVGAFE